MAELGAFFGNPNLQRQGARARALAGQRDVNTLADPRTYAIVQGLLGTRPDEMGFSVLNPDYEKIKKVAEPAFALGLLGQAAPMLAPLTKGLPVGASIKNVGKFDVVKRDASDIFGEGAQRIRYTDPKSSGSIEVLAKPDGTASVLSLEVPEKFRGKKIGESLQKQVLEDFPDMQGQVSSKAAATTAYRIGRRPVDMPDATLKDVYKMIDEDSSVNMISTQMQQRIAPTLETGLLGSRIPSPSSLTMPDVPTAEQMQKFGRVETVPLSQAVSFQSARNWDKFNKGEYSGDLVQGFGDKPLALRLENGEYIIYDGNHRTDLAMQAGKTELPMNVIDVKSYDPSNAGRRPVPPSMTDDELLRSLLE
jgi:ribosomal protein S18 acetylase RimI-like enzyme